MVDSSTIFYVIQIVNFVLSVLSFGLVLIGITLFLFDRKK